MSKKQEKMQRKLQKQLQRQLRKQKKQKLKKQLKKRKCCLCMERMGTVRGGTSSGNGPIKVEFFCEPCSNIDTECMYCGVTLFEYTPANTCPGCQMIQAEALEEEALSASQISNYFGTRQYFLQTPPQDSFRYWDKLDLIAAIRVELERKMKVLLGEWC